MKSLRLLALLPVAVAATAQIAPPASTVFDKDAVHEIRITLKEPNWYEILTDTYNRYPDNTPYLEGALVWGQYKFDSVGIRFKGNSSYRGATTRKKPFRIKLNEFTKGQKIDGMASFSLSNGWNDPSFVREKTYYEMAAKSGLAASRSNFAALYVNDEYLGLYILSEIVNGDYLDNHFGKNDNKGNLYKASDPGANLAYLGEDPAAYQPYFSKESNEDANDWTDLIALARLFDLTSGADFPARARQLLDVDSFLTALALDNITVNLDSYVGMAQNYFLYRRPSDGKWVWIVWDPSLAFGALGQGLSAQQLRNLSLEWTQSSGINGPAGIPTTSSANSRLIATRLWEVPEFKARYREIYKAIAEQVMIPQEIVARMNELRNLIRPWVEKDTQKLVTEAQFDNAMSSDAITAAPTGPGQPGQQPGGGAPLGGAPALEPFLHARSVSVKAQLAGQTPPLFSAVPLSYAFAQVAGTTTPLTTSLALSLPSGTGTYAARSSAPWLTLTNAEGTLPATVRLTASAAALTPGTYTTAVTVAVTGTTNSPLSIPVTLVVTSAPAIVTSPAQITLTTGNFVFGGPGGPQGPGQPPQNPSQSLTIVSTAGTSAFTAALTDSTCGSALTVAPTSGTTPATLTVTASTAGLTASCTARLTLTSSGLATATVPVTVNIAPPPGPPGGFQPGANGAITAVANSASFQPGPVSPGALITLLGTNVGPRNAATATPDATGQYPTTLNGVTLTFDGVAAPILDVRPAQISAVVPFEVAGRPQTTLTLSLNGRPTGTLPVSVGPTSPGIFTTAATGSGQGNITNANGTINAANAPAAKGSAVTIYATGCGALMPAGRTGAFGNATQTVTAPVGVAIGGQPATVTASTAAPGLIQGICRITATVPAGAPSGNVPVSLTIGAAPAQNGVTMYVQ